MEAVFASLASEQHFFRTDFVQACLQMEAGGSAKKNLTIITYKGLFQSNWLVFAIMAAFAVWQGALEQVPRGMAGTPSHEDESMGMGPPQSPV